MRIYNEQETQELLRQAAALQAAKRDFTTGLTLDEIRRVAAEAGIDPAFVEQAAMGAPPPPVQQKSGFWGGAYRLERERLIDHEVDGEEWTAMLDEIRRGYGHVGETKEIGRGFEWSYGYPQYGSAYVYGHVSVAPRRGRTRIRATRRLSNQTLVFLLPFLPAIFAVIFGIIAVAGDKVSGIVPLVLTLITLVAFVGARALFGSMSRKAEREMEEMMERLEEIAGESEQYAAEQEREAGETKPLREGRLDADALDFDAPPEAAAERRRRRTR